MALLQYLVSSDRSSFYNAHGENALVIGELLYVRSYLRRFALLGESEQIGGRLASVKLG